MRRKCSYCGKVKTVKYQYQSSGDNYCSESCAAAGIHIYSVYKCAFCGTRLNETEPERVFKREVPFVVHLAHQVPVYCSLECALRANGCVKIKNRNYESEQGKEDGDE